MGSMSFDLGFVGTLSVDPMLLASGRQLLKESRGRRRKEVPVAPGCATILAAAALEISLESQLKLAQLWAARGGRSAGLPYSPVPAAIEDALRQSVWWKVQNVPAVVTAGMVTLGGQSPELLAVIRALISCRNELVHGRGEVLDHLATLEIPRPDSPMPPRLQVSGEQNGLKIRAETVAGPIEFDLLAAKPWGKRWLEVERGEATGYLDAVETYINRVLAPLNKQGP